MAKLELYLSPRRLKMKNIYLITAVLCFINMGCKKEQLDPLIGKWQVTQRSPYSYEQEAASFDPRVFVDVKPGYYIITLSGDGTYTSNNTTYMSIKSSGRYSSEQNKLTLIQEKVNDKESPLITNYTFASSDKNNGLTISEIKRQSSDIIAIIKMRRIE